MLPRISTQRQLIPLEFDIMVNVHNLDDAGKKDTIFTQLRWAIHDEYRKYLKVKKQNSAGPTFTHERCISFVIVHPTPPYGKCMTYRLSFGPNMVIVTPTGGNFDPKIAPFLEPVNLAQMESEFFNPLDFEPRQRKLTRYPSECPTDSHRVNDMSQQAAVIPFPEKRLITTSRAPAISEDRPYIRFGGEYLEKFGFTIGTPVTIHLEQNKIMLTVAAVQKASEQSA